MDDFSLDFNRSQINDQSLEKIRTFAKRENDNDPIIRENTAAFYKTLLALKRPRKLLEAGTSIGYSAILAGETLRQLEIDFRIDTVEIDEVTADKAQSNFKSLGFENNEINLILGDSVEIFGCLSGKYDMIFLDSSKSHYIDMLPDVKRLLNKGGLLVCDDIIFYGKTIDESENIPHKHRTIVNNLRNFVESIKNDTDFISFLDPIDDGVLIAVYNGD